MPVSRLHGASHAVIECQMPGPTGESSLMNVSGCPCFTRGSVPPVRMSPGP